MKAIMKTIKPKSCANIMNLIQSILVIKNKIEANAIQKLIDENGYVDIYVYCSKNEYLLRTNKGYIATKKPLTVGKDTEYTFAYSDEGKVLFKFRCHKVEEIKRFFLSYKDYSLYRTSKLDFDELEKASCLSRQKLDNYLKDKKGYAIHISDLEIFDEPKELSEFQGTCIGCEAFRLKVCNLNLEQCDRHLTKAPKNFTYIESER